MDRLSLVRFLESQQLPVFTTQQFAALVGVGADSAAVMLSRLAKDGVLTRVLRGRYSLPSTNVLAVATGIYVPSYASLWAAFEHHGTTTQSPRVIDVINPLRSGRLSLGLEEGDFIVRFVKTNVGLIYGFKKEHFGEKVAFVAEKEKAVVDGLLFPGHVPFDEVVSAVRSGVDEVKAMEYARRSGRQTVLKRLGHLLSGLGAVHPDPDDESLSGTYVPLDPAHPRRGRHDTRWKVIINRVVE